VYNVDLVRRFLADWRIACPVLPPSPYLEFKSHELEILKNRFLTKFQIPVQDRLIFIHPGSGGSANNLRPEQFAYLAASLRSDRAVTFIVSAGPNERSIAEKLVSLMKGRNLSVCLYTSNEGLVSFAAHLSLADLFISGSTGPLHIAGALNVRTVGFYPSKRSSTPLRWQTLSEPQRRLAFSPPEHSQDDEVLNIDIDYTAKTINEHFLSSSPPDVR
jgi:ADP-heptose:LPS heptosyltransferase